MVEGAAGTSRRRVVIVDDHAAFADMFQVDLERVDDLECVGSAASLAEAVQGLLTARHRRSTWPRRGRRLDVVRRLRVTATTSSSSSPGPSDTYALATVAVAGARLRPGRARLTELVTILRQNPPA